MRGCILEVNHEGSGGNQHCLPLCWSWPGVWDIGIDFQIAGSGTCCTLVSGVKKFHAKSVCFLIVFLVIF